MSHTLFWSPSGGRERDENHTLYRLHFQRWSMLTLLRGKLETLSGPNHISGIEVREL